MKQIGISIGLIFLLVGCSPTEYDYKLENNILECFYQRHKDNDIEVESIIDRLENLLIAHDILQNKSGESYIRVIEQIRDDSDLKIDNPKLIADINSIGYIPSSIFCHDSAFVTNIDSIDFANSKLKYVTGIFDSIQAMGEISPTLIAEGILKVFDAQDFENEFYRTIGLVVFSNMIKMNDYEGGLARKLPPPLKEGFIKIEEQNVFVILVNKDGEILADGLLINITDLKDSVKKFILETSDKKKIDLPLIGQQMTSKGVISFQNNRRTSYELYIAVSNELVKAYKEIRDNYSLKFFNLPFDSLGKEEQKVIKDLVPHSISEAEPEM